MFLLYVKRMGQSVFGYDRKTKLIYTNLDHIVNIVVNENTLCIYDTDNTHYYKYFDEENARKMVERILLYKSIPNHMKEPYLEIVEATCPTFTMKVNGVDVPCNYNTYKKQQKLHNQHQRMDQPGPDIDALMILQEYDKSLMVQQQLK